MDRAETVGSVIATPLYVERADTQAGMNYLFSRLASQLALAMGAMGARGDTRKVMANLIGAPENVGEGADQVVRARRDGGRMDTTPPGRKERDSTLCQYRYASCPKS
jgi:hypothetical protein